MQNIQFNMSQTSQQDDDDQIDMINIDESNIEMMNKKLRKNVTGLINLGNTCYLNSMIQSLYSCRKFVWVLNYNLTIENGLMNFYFKIFKVHSRNAAGKTDEWYIIFRSIANIIFNNAL